MLDASISFDVKIEPIVIKETILFKQSIIILSAKKRAMLSADDRRFCTLASVSAHLVWF